MNIINLIMPPMLLVSLPEMIENAITWIQQTFSRGNLENLAAGEASTSGSMMANLAMQVLTFSGLDGKLVGGLISYITGPVGLVIMVISFLTSFINQFKSGHELTLDDVARPLFFFVLADLILTNIDTVISALMGISNQAGAYLIQQWPAIIEGASEEAGSEEPSAMSNMSIIGLMLVLVFQFLGMFLSIFASAVLYVVLLTAKMEVLLRFAYAPIGLANIADESRKDDTFRYFKKLVASAFYLVAIVGALMYANMLSLSVLTSTGQNDPNIIVGALATLESSIYSAALPFAAVGIVSVAKNVVNESFGT